MTTAREFKARMNYTLNQFLTPAVKWILLLNCLVFLLFNLVFGPLKLDVWFLNTFAQNPIVFVEPTLAGGYAYSFNYLCTLQFITYMFVHVQFFHLFLNMLVLFFFGPVMEYKWGTAGFLKFYLFTGFMAGLFHGILAPFLPAIARSYWMFGASGAIFGLLVAFAYYYPHQKVLFMFFIPMPAWVAVAIFGVIALSALLEGTRTSQISHLTHLAGFGFGFLWVWAAQRAPNLWVFNNDPRPFARGLARPDSRYTDL